MSKLKEVYKHCTTKCDFGWYKINKSHSTDVICHYANDNISVKEMLDLGLSCPKSNKNGK